MSDQVEVSLSADAKEYLSAIQASGVFGKSGRRLRLLEHLLQSEIAGEGHRLKAYALGIDVFGKPESFDPATDSLVRVEMGRVRAAIDRFEADNPTTILRIEIPTGTYRPVISKRVRSISEPVRSNVSPQRMLPNRTLRWLFLPISLGVAVALASVFLWFKGPTLQQEPPDTIGIQVRAFQGPSDLANDVEAGIREAISRSTALNLLDPPNHFVFHEDADFVVSGHIRGGPLGQTITARLTATETNVVLWTGSVEIGESAPLFEVVRQSLGADLRVRVYGASRQLLEQFDPDDLSAEALFVLGTWVPGPAFATQEWEEERLSLVLQALEVNPDYGPAHSVVADKLTYLANIYEASDGSHIQALAEWHAQQALSLAPLDADVMFNVAQSQWHGGQLAQSVRTMSRVIELDPSHDVARFLRSVIPYTCSSAPTEVLQAAIDFDDGLATDSPIRWLTLTWIGWLHAYREEWQEALDVEEDAALIFEIPYMTMRRAMILSQLDRMEDAADVIAAQSQNWPGFDPAHFADVTIPRLCQEAEDPEVFIGYYGDLIEGLAQIR